MSKGVLSISSEKMDILAQMFCIQPFSDSLPAPMCVMHCIIYFVYFICCVVA